MSAIWTLCVLQDKDILGGLMLDVMECLWCLLISVGDDISVPQEVTLAIKVLFLEFSYFLDFYEF